MQTRGRVLITDGVHPLLMEGLQSAGFDCDYRPAIQTEEVLSIIEHYVGLIINSKILVDRKMLDKGRVLKFVGRLGSGMEIVDQPYAKQKNVHAISSPEGNRNAVAEHVMGMLLALSNKLLIADKEVRQLNWNREINRGFELKGKTIGIIGFGNTGSTLAEKLTAWGVNVLAYDKYISNFANHLQHVKETTMEEVFKLADVVSLHLPLTPETYHLVDNTFLNKMAKPIVLINASRGKIVDTQAVLDGLDSGKLIGACLDVFENEKPNTFNKVELKKYQQLYTYNNVVLSPHIAGWTKESKKKLAEILLNKILSVV